MTDQLVPGKIQEAAELRGEWKSFSTDSGSVNGYFVESQLKSAPGLVVVHEAFGVNEHIMDLARRFSAEGFNVVAPDLYSRSGPPDVGDMKSVLDHMFNMGDDRVTVDLEVAADQLRNFSNSNGKVGAIGFCSGGRSVLIFACSGATIDAAIDCWGGFVLRATNDELATPERPTPPIELLANLKCPFLAIGGEEDGNPSPADLAALERAMTLAKVPGQTRVFDNAGHAFLADYRPTYRRDAAFRLWPVLVTFLLENLAS